VKKVGATPIINKLGYFMVSTCALHIKNNKNNTLTIKSNILDTLTIKSNILLL